MSSSKIWKARLLLSMSSLLTPSMTSKPRSKTKKKPQFIDRELSSMERRLKKALSLTTTFNKNQFSSQPVDQGDVVFNVVISWSNFQQARLFLSILMILKPLTASRPKFKTRKESHLINRCLSSMERKSRMALSLTTIFNKNQLSTYFLDLKNVCPFQSNV